MWFLKSNKEVFAELGVDPARGLSEKEAEARLQKHGPNKLSSKKRKSIFRLFVDQLKQWLIYVLFAAVVITLFMGEYIDAIIILLVIFTNAILGVIQEVKAGKAIQALQKMTLTKVLVRREGETREIDSEKIVPGDVLILDAGRMIAADLRLIESVELQIEESALTGESVPAQKDANRIFTDKKTPLGDRANSAFMSTMVTKGRGVAIVVETGMNTQVGEIAKSIDSDEETKTPLEIRLDKLGKTLAKFAIGICVLIMVITLIQGRDFADMFLISVSMAVAAIPEGLAAIVAVVLSVGVTGMSKQNAIIKRLAAVETLGSVSVICTDKTGTLTQNKMTVTQFANLEVQKSIENKEDLSPDDDVKLMAKAFVLSSDATYENKEGTGDPTEIALLLFADEMQLNRKELAANTKRLGEYAFDSDRKLMSTLVEEEGKYTVYTKGAIDNLIKLSTHVRVNGEVVAITQAHRDKYSQITDGMTNDALRTLGVAYKPVDQVVDASQMESDLILLGLVGQIDPPRTEVHTSIQKAKSAGITTVMITGDHKNTAFAIAKELSIADNINQAITGQELEEFSEKEFSDKVSRYRVFARVSPEHKVKIVRALKANGNVVSMTGDGVNDAPSLNVADIGVAMGITGTDVAKGASDMILTDDNFATIVSAIEYGRNIYENIKKSVIFLLTCNLGEVVAIFMTLLVGWAAPLIATQILWINLITDSFPAIALGMDPGNPDVMEEKPRDSKAGFFSKTTLVRMVLGGVLIGALTIFAFWMGYAEHGYSPFDSSVPETTVEYARTMAFIVLVMSQLFYSLALRSSYKSIFTVGIFSNKYLVGALVLGAGLQLLVLNFTPLQQAFRLQPLAAIDWVLVIGLGLIPLFVNELVKIGIRYKMRKTV